MFVLGGLSRNTSVKRELSKRSEGFGFRLTLIGEDLHKLVVWGSYLGNWQEQ